MGMETNDEVVYEGRIPFFHCLAVKLDVVRFIETSGNANDKT